MNCYVNYCTEEQTRKAYKLGAPIEIAKPWYRKDSKLYKIDNMRCYRPTSQQMFGWLRDKYHINLRNVIDGGDTIHLEAWQYNKQIVQIRNYPKEAELAAIDAVFNYLEKGE